MKFSAKKTNICLISFYYVGTTLMIPMFVRRVFSRNKASFRLQPLQLLVVEITAHGEGAI